MNKDGAITTFEASINMAKMMQSDIVSMSMQTAEEIMKIITDKDEHCCPKCGRPIFDDAQRYCYNCGHDLKGEIK